VLLVCECGASPVVRPLAHTQAGPASGDEGGPVIDERVRD